VNERRWFLAPPNQWNERVEVWIRDYSGKESRVVSPVAFNSVEVGEYEESPPSMVLHRHEAQQIMDSLWQGGFRPNSGESSVAHVDAMKQHIDTLKKTSDAFIDIALSQMKAPQ
jgi:hypothetical protein